MQWCDMNLSHPKCEEVPVLSKSGLEQQQQQQQQQPNQNKTKQNIMLLQICKSRPPLEWGHELSNIKG
jgi:hypothetical protein